MDRIATLLVLGFSVLLLFWAIPNQIEEVEFGRIRPETLPMFLGWVLAALAALQLISSRSVKFDLRLVSRTVVAFAIVIGGAILMMQIGFEFAMPIMALLLMLLLAERRPFWLALGVLIVPVGVWALVEILLDRPLA